MENREWRGKERKEDGFRGFYLAFSTMVALTPQVKDPMYGLLYLSSMSTPIIHSEIREMSA